jgi:inorganic pyrophosphatase
VRYIDIPVGEYAPEAFNVVVEIPKGSLNKYEYDPKLNLFRLGRALESPFHFHGEYGFLPSTEGVDGCPLDALVMTKTPTFPGCIIEARAIGMFGMIDLGVEDLRLLCVPTCDSRFDWLADYRDLNQHELNDIKQFFLAYDEIHGKETITHEWLGVALAKEILLSAIERFNNRKVTVRR